MHTRTVIDGTAVTFLEANHCPGAVMVLFEPPAPAQAVLHTGDFRFSAEAVAPYEGLLRAASAARSAGGGGGGGEGDGAGPGLHLILDTTYCSPEHAFPSQAEAVRFVADTVRAESGANGHRTLFLFGTYTIGKERVFLEARGCAVALCCAVVLLCSCCVVLCSRCGVLRCCLS